MEQLAKAVQAEPGNYELRMIFGRTLRDAKKPLDAANQFAAAAKIKPDAVDAWNELAGQLILTDRLADGLAALDHVKALGRELPGDVYLRAITLDKLHQKPQAVASYKQFLTMSEGKFPDQEFAARQRIRIIEQELHR
jgi:tetratricopeptide (TPR) repeat protein